MKAKDIDFQLQEEAQLITDKDLQRARGEYLAEQDKETPSPKVKFQYAFILTKSTIRDNKFRGIGLLEDLMNDGYEKTECLYWIALAYYSLNDYTSSRKFCERLLRIRPDNSKALALHGCIKEVLSAEDHTVGLGIAAGAVVVAGIALKFLLKKD